MQNLPSFLPPTNTHLLMQIPNNPPSFADGRREKKKEESSLMAKEKEKGSAIMAPMKIFNGERVVVLLTIIRLFFSMKLPLVWEGVALFLLAVAALFVEFIVDPCGIPCFKTRAGASSGILLGSTTLPMVMLSRLIQFSRAPSDRVGIAEIKYLNMQYWCASVGSLVVLVFLSFILSNMKDKKKLVHMERLHLIPMSVFYLLLFLIPCCLSLAEKSDTGYLVGTKAAWILSHGFASALLVQYVLYAFPSCASIGEAILTTGGLFLYFSDGLLYTLSKVDFRCLMNLSFTHYGARRSLISTIMQGVLVGLLLSCLMFKYVIQAWDFLATQFNREGRVNDTRNDLSVDSRRSILFYVSIGVTLFISAPLWMHAVQDFREHPYTWIFTFILQKPLKRILLCAYWVALISPAVLWFYNISKNSKVERILLRKFYHLLAVAMFVPAVLFQSEFLDLAFAGALAVFLVLEMIRVWRVWPFGNLIHQFMNAFTDHRDSELLIISHFSLLLGCALPKWLSSGFNDRPLAPFAGILSLGIGDTMEINIQQR